MNKKQARTVRIMCICAFALATVSIAFGIFRGETDVVLKKAVRICLECIGVA